MLHEQIARQGNWLFRWRSYLPAVLIAPMLLALRDFDCAGQPGRTHASWTFACMAVSLLGLALRFFTVAHVPQGTSGRNTKDGQIAETLNTTGMYSVVRHPLYLGNFLVALGPVMFFNRWWFLLLYCLAFWLYYERIMYVEEAYLQNKFGQAFIAWARGTPAFLPSIRCWVRPSLPFSFRSALRREYQTFFGIVAAFVALEAVERAVMDHDPPLEPSLAVAFAAALSFYVVVRFLKKKTDVLDVEGR